MTQHRVGIFMPCYNMGDFIEGALDSVYAQSFQDFQVVVADDCSTDAGTLDTLRRINRSRCEVYFEPENLGLVAISNRYMSSIDAEYIMLFSPDDKMHPDFLKVQVEYLESHPDVHAVCTWIEQFGDIEGVIKYDDDGCTLPAMLVRNQFSGAALMRKSAWLEAGMHDTDPELFPNLDYDLWLSMLQRGFVLGTIPQALFYWRSVKTSLSHGVNPDQIAIFRRALLRKYAELYREHFQYVIDFYLGELSRFEHYYHESVEGHAWLDEQYWKLTAENEDLRQKNIELQTAHPSWLRRVIRRN